MLSQMSLRLYSLFFSVFPPCCLEWIISIHLLINSLFPLIFIFLLIESCEFFILLFFSSKFPFDSSSYYLFLCWDFISFYSFQEQYSEGQSPRMWCKKVTNSRLIDIPNFPATYQSFTSENDLKSRWTAALHNKG